MQLEPHYPPGSIEVDQVEALRLTYGDGPPENLLRGLVAEFPGQVALVSSFGAEAAVLLHLISKVDRDLPVLLVDTLMLFEETLEYQRTLSELLGLTNVQHIHPDPLDLAVTDPSNDLHTRDLNACCSLRKVAPLERALVKWPVVISGRKRFQAGTRSSLEVFEANNGGLRVNPLAHWTARELREYMDNHSLPRHPLVASNFLSIGCAPCTSKVSDGEDVRAGRWRGTDKVECGIHFDTNGQILRQAG